jgi:hypothetical protein
MTSGSICLSMIAGHSDISFELNEKCAVLMGKDLESLKIYYQRRLQYNNK